ncbi:hypothetical protein K1719_004211 [Acacia pycnantha]|nr:hypothetical protein K1719_004211 [Acacia pycnantha]
MCRESDPPISSKHDLSSSFLQSRNSHNDWCICVKVISNCWDIHKGYTALVVVRRRHVIRKLSGFDIHHRHPPVERLSFHLPHQQSVYYTERESMSSLVSNPRVKESMFLAWFEKNKDDPFVRTLTYSQFPNFFTFVREKRLWKIRERGFSVGRIGHCTPAQGELYYLRLLLTKVRGPKNYPDIRTINNGVFPTFREACYAYGLLDDDNEYIDTIKEASLWASGNYLRQFFTSMLLSHCLSQLAVVWEQTKEIICEDLLHISHGDQRFSVQSILLSIIQQLLIRNGRSLDDYPSLPKPDEDNIIDISNQLILQELNYNKQKESEESQRLQRMMTDEQKQVFDGIMDVVSSKKGGFFFLHGFGGTGKNFIWNALTASVRSNGGIILNVASSGIAATLLPSAYLNAIKCSGIPHHKLVLKVGVPIMLLRNIDQAARLCNGTRLQIKQLGKNVIKAKALNGTSIGEDILIHIMDMNPSEAKLPFTMTRRQFPIIISFAMTINKSQGQSMFLVEDKPSICFLATLLDVSHQWFQFDDLYLSLIKQNDITVSQNCSLFQTSYKLMLLRLSELKKVEEDWCCC